jgi:hypothetical protein
LEYKISRLRQYLTVVGNIMRHILIFISFVFPAILVWGQNVKKQGNSPPWSDTTFIIVKLNDTINDNKVVAVDIGEKATIYVKLKPILDEARQNLSNDFVKEDYQKVIHFLSTAPKKNDTTFLSDYFTLPHFEYLISHQLVNGNAKVFYKKQKTFIDKISHRLERYGGNADRFFYLPDKRPFFAVKEYSGILDDNNPFGKGHYEAYVKEGEKLLSLREQ